ncbi:MAG: hypothetical protein JWO73_887 [Candidatus Taylorbacteria bacterium]|nr:hypothetical protein [Candidatus Taylorbacteria bacterium]
MPRAKNEKQKPVIAPLQDEDEIEILKPKDGPIDIPEADEKAIDPDLLEAEEEVSLEDEEEDEEAAVLDVEEVDPFGDKWEQ